MLPTATDGWGTHLLSRCSSTVRPNQLPRIASVLGVGSSSSRAGLAKALTGRAATHHARGI
jgi:hypothetical protein